MSVMGKKEKKIGGKTFSFLMEHKMTVLIFMSIQKINIIFLSLSLEHKTFSIRLQQKKGNKRLKIFPRLECPCMRIHNRQSEQN